MISKGHLYIEKLEWAKLAEKVRESKARNNNGKMINKVNLPKNISLQTQVIITLCL